MSNLQNYQHYVAQFKAFEQNGASKSPTWVNDVRKNALIEFTNRGFPTTKQEDWKYTNIAPIAKASFQYSAHSAKISSNDIKKYLVDGIDQYVIAFVNGHFSKEHSQLNDLPKNVVVKNLIDAYAAHGDTIQQHLAKYVKFEKNSFSALNAAFLNDGAFVHIPAKTEIEKSIHLLFISTNSGSGQFASHIRNLIVVEEEAKVSFVHSFYSVGDHQNLTNAVTEIVARKNSTVELVKVQNESESAYHVENLQVHQYEKSNVQVFSLALGGAISRNDLSVIIDGEAAECNLNGLYIVSGQQVIDHHTFMHHIHPNCPSHELFKGILNGNGRAVFNGKVYVNPEAQKTDSKQTNRNLILSDTAVVDTKPELEIFADDVKCTHGAAVGGLNDSHAFYLKSRGITKELSKTILTVGFAAEVTEKIRSQALRRQVDLLVVNNLKLKLGSSNLPDIVHAV
jgi:Fe-S cluster assembly protein SufD